jgi:hypothetical protein
MVNTYLNDYARDSVIDNIWKNGATTTPQARDGIYHAV